MQKNAKRNKNQERWCDKAILDTLEYRSIFKAGLSKHQLATLTVTTKKTLDPQVLDKRITNLHKSKKIRVRSGAYFVGTSTPISWQSRYKQSKEVLKRNGYIFKLLGSIKWIRMVGVTGSTAAYSAAKSDDVDLFIVTENNRLWLSRLFVFLILKSLGVYYKDDDSGGKFCPNIFVDESSLAWPKEKRNIYTAHEVLLMQPMHSKKDAYLKFIKENEWVFEYFAGFSITLPKKFSIDSKYRSSVVDKLEDLSRKLQLRYMKDRQTTEVTSRHMIHFNKHDHSDQILNAYKRVSE